LLGDVPPATQRAWLPNGFKSYDNKNFDHVQAVEFTWQDPEYPGTWYVFVKSLNATSPTKDIYKFRDAGQLPAEPFGGGYHP
jgi:hypothetical protein